MNAPILEARELKRYFSMGTGLFDRGGAVIKAVDAVSFKINLGETLGLIGESGCGKTTVARLTLGLAKPTAGILLFNGVDVRSDNRDVYREYRRSVQAVFQDPQSSLNPRMRVSDIVAEPVEVNLNLGRKETRARVLEVLNHVGIGADMADRFPHQFSGGQRQRIAIARALAVQAKVVILDEPVASLDVSVRSQVLNLLRDLQEEFGLSYLLISHDLATSAYLCHQIAVMYLGRIVETGPAEEIYRAPIHPYTRALLEAADIILSQTVGEELDSAEIPNPISPPQGCHFHPRCPRAMPVCSIEVPAARQAAPGHWVSCHLYS